MNTNRTFDAVAAMREAREKLEREWQGKPREEEIESLRRKFAGLSRQEEASSRIRTDHWERTFMITVTTQQLKANLSELLGQVANDYESIAITRRGKKIAGIVPAKGLELLEEILDLVEDEMDASVVEERLKCFGETGEGIPWEQLKKELGL